MSTLMRTPSFTDIDTRYVFRLYAAQVALVGLLLIAWGPKWVGPSIEFHPWLKAELIRIFGSILIGAACVGAAMSQIEDPEARRKAAGWFALAHAVVGGVIVTQSAVVGEVGKPWVGNLLMAVMLTFFFFFRNPEGEMRDRSLTTLFTARDSTERVRSRYEEQIRQAASIEERNRLARDLHDSVKQQLFVIQTAAATAQARFGSDADGTRLAIDHVREGAREAIAEMQAMLDQLRASPLDNTGLIEALKKQSEALGFRTGVEVHFEIGELPPNESVAPGGHEALFRSAQEALSNIARHARAKNVWISIFAIGGKFTLRIRDDGAGFDPNQGRRGMGLANIHTRAEEYGGMFEIMSRAGNGTLVSITIPYQLPPKEDAGGIALVMGLVLLASIPGVVKNYTSAWVTALAAIEFTRQLLKYLRTRKLRAAAVPRIAS
jgi:signal transduction histidine kinase